ncbi:MAG: hypothetical protein J5852_05875 [Clostridia bacterium]|nr:hypothetical protein [Clostridia bacterium]
MIIAKVKNQNINLFYDDVVSNSVKYLKIRFEFSNDWSGYTKTAIFHNEYTDTTVTVLMVSGETLYIGENTCLVPHEVIKSPEFTVSVCGVFGESTITSDAKKIIVHESGYRQGETPAEPTPSEYERIAQIAATASQTANSVREDADNGLFKGEKGDKGDTPDMSDYYTKTQTNNLLNTKQNRFCNLTSAGGVERMEPDFDSSVLFFGKFRFSPDPYAEEQREDLINRYMLESYHDGTKANKTDVYVKSQTYSKSEVDTALSGKQNTLTAGSNITISGDVISASAGGNGWRTICDVTLDASHESTTYPHAIIIDKDSNNNDYVLSQARIRLYVPADGTLENDNYNGYLICSTSDGSNYLSFGAFNWKYKSEDKYYVIDAFTMPDFPAHVNFSSPKIGGGFNDTVKTYFDRNGRAARDIKKITILLNSTSVHFKSGTHIIIEGIDK